MHPRLENRPGIGRRNCAQAGPHDAEAIADARAGLAVEFTRFHGADPDVSSGSAQAAWSRSARRG
jgi:hypothetical protein